LTEYLDGISAFLPQIIGSAGPEEFDHFAGLKKGDAAASQENVPLHSEAEPSRRAMSGLLGNSLNHTEPCQDVTLLRW
jgi:hypothetical protein